jgi:hypothetical protein
MKRDLGELEIARGGQLSSDQVFAEVEWPLLLLVHNLQGLIYVA